MRFEEITNRTKIIITVSNGTDMQARFMSKVMKNLGDSILVIPFRHKGKRISFVGNNIRVHLEVRDADGILWNFKNCKVVTIKKDGLVYHKLISPMRTGIENRRGGRRFYVWEQGVFHIDEINKQFFANIRDMGLSGFSFLVDYKKGTEIKEGMKVGCYFKNKDGDEIKLQGMIVRREMLEKYIVYGVKLDDPQPDYIAYVKYLEKKNTIVDVQF